MEQLKELVLNIGKNFSETNKRIEYYKNEEELLEKELRQLKKDFSKNNKFDTIFLEMEAWFKTQEYKNWEIKKRALEEKMISTIKNNKTILNVRHKYFYGMPGIGKTYWISKLPKEFQILNWNRLIEKELNAIKGNEDSFKSNNYWMRREYLVLEEFGATKFTTFNTRLFYNLIEYRTSNKMPLIIISNMSPTWVINEMKKCTKSEKNYLDVNDEIMAERIKSRLKYFEVFQLKGTDQRNTNILWGESDEK